MNKSEKHLAILVKTKRSYSSDHKIDLTLPGYWVTGVDIGSSIPGYRVIGWI